MKRGLWLPLTCFLLATLLHTACETSNKEIKKQEPPDTPTEFKYTRGGAPIEVIVQLSKSKLDLIDFLTVTIESRFEEGVQVTPPYLSETVYSPLLLVDNPREETFWSEEHNRLVNRWTYKFEPLISGKFKLKPFVINFRLDKEKTAKIGEWPVYQVHTESIDYEVKPTDIGKLDDIRDIKGLIYPPYKIWIPIVTGLTLLFLSTSLFLLLRYRKNQQPEFNISTPLIDYYADALNKLHALEQQDYISKAEFNVFHTELTSILRNYLEHHFGLRAKEQTTEEFIQEIVRTRTFSEEQRYELNRFLQLADLVKFATFQPGPQISEDALGNVRTFIQTTGKPDEV